MLLSIPLKTSKRIDIETPLKKWVDSSHPQYRADQLSSDLKRLNAIRSDLSESVASSSSHAYALTNSALSDLTEYHACLVECLNHGFPSDSRDADVNGTMDAKLQFKWKNAFVEFDGNDDDALTPQSQTHFTYERVCILWNIAALYSYKAMVEADWTTKDGRTIVHKSYSVAAQIFRHMKYLLKGTKESNLSPDLYGDSLEMCQCMCLAQGQIAAYEALKLKLVDPNVTSSTYTLLSKVSAGIAEHANRALEASQALSIKDHKSSKAWGGHLKVMSMLYHARAEFLQSQVERRESNYGNEIARLERAVNMAREGIEFMKLEGFVKIPDGPASLGKIPHNLKSLLKNAKERKRLIVDENTRIYMTTVPNANKMDKIVGSDVMQYDDKKDSELPPEFMPVSLTRPLFASISFVRE
jgi:hypothetical protein